MCGFSPALLLGNNWFLTSGLSSWGAWMSLPQCGLVWSVGGRCPRSARPAGEALGRDHPHLATQMPGRLLASDPPASPRCELLPGLHGLQGQVPVHGRPGKARSQGGGRGRQALRCWGGASAPRGPEVGAGPQPHVVLRWGRGLSPTWSCGGGGASAPHGPEVGAGPQPHVVLRWGRGLSPTWS